MSYKSAYFVCFISSYSRESGKPSDKYCLSFETEKEAKEKANELKEIGGLSRIRVTDKLPKDYYSRKHYFK